MGILRTIKDKIVPTGQRLSTKHVRARHAPLLVVLSAIIVFGALFTWWMAKRTDRALREGLLSKTNLITKSVNFNRVKILTGTENDLDTQDSAAVISAHALSQAAMQLEAAGREEKLGNAETLLEDMQTEFNQVKSFLSQSNWMEMAKVQSTQQPVPES